MNTFNMILSTSRDFERAVEAEMRYNLFILGDETPIIIKTAFQGLLFVNTKLNPYEVIENFKKTLHRDPSFFQFILRIMPNDLVVGTNIELIHDCVMELYNIKKNLTKQGTYGIQIRKRATNMRTSEIISSVAADINNKVDLKNPDWVVQIEIFGDTTGVSIYEPKYIFKIQKEKEILIKYIFPKIE